MRIASDSSDAADQAVERRPHVGRPAPRCPRSARRPARAARAAALPPTVFLSRASAAQAASRSTRTGCGSSCSPHDRERRVVAREPERRDHPERDRLPVREVVAGGGLERVPERVAEVELVARAAVVRVGEADRRLERRRSGARARRAAAPRPGSPISRPVFTTSAIPFRCSAAGSVSSVPGRSRPAPASGTRRSGSCRPEGRPRSCRRSPRRPGRRGVVGTATHGTPRMYVAAANPARSVVQPPPRPTIVPSRPIRSARQSRSSTAIAFAGSPGGTSWRGDVAVAERELGRDAVDPGDVRVGDDLDRARRRARARRADRARRSGRRSRPRRARPRPRRARARRRPPRRPAAARGRARGTPARRSRAAARPRSPASRRSRDRRRAAP